MRGLVAVLAAACIASPAAAHDGWGIVVDRAGRVYFPDIPTNSVWLVIPGRRPERWLTGIHSHALALDAVDRVYGTNIHFTEPIRALWRRAPRGPVEYLVPPTHGLPMSFQSFLLGPDGSVYSANAYEPHVPPERRELLLLKRDSSGRTSALAGSGRGHVDGIREQARFESIDGMAWSGDTAILVADGPYLRVVTLDGRVTTIGGRALTRTRWDEDLAGVAARPDGAVFVADFASRVVLRVRGDGRKTVAWRSSLIWSPTGVTFSPGNEMYVLEHLRMPLAVLGNLGIGPYVQVWSVAPDGSRTQLARIWGRNSWVLALIAGLIIGLQVLLQVRRRRRS